MHLMRFCVKKMMKAERNVAADTLRGTLLLRMATLGTLAKQRRCHPEGSLPSSMIPPGLVSGGIFSQKGISIVKKRMERGFKPPREAARSIQVSRFCFEIWERESAPAN
jgi:hypothetical protein